MHIYRPFAQSVEARCAARLPRNYRARSELQRKPGDIISCDSSSTLRQESGARAVNCDTAAAGRSVRSMKQGWRELGLLCDRGLLGVARSLQQLSVPADQLNPAVICNCLRCCTERRLAELCCTGNLIKLTGILRQGSQQWSRGGFHSEA